MTADPRDLMFKSSRQPAPSCDILRNAWNAARKLYYESAMLFRDGNYPLPMVSFPILGKLEASYVEGLDSGRDS